MIRTLPLLLLLTVAPAHAADWVAAPDQSRLGFTGTAQGERFEGRFGRFEPQIRFDPTDLASARFEVRIEVASADTANAERDEALHSHDFFAVRRHPHATYVAETFRELGDGRYAADGELTLRGVTRPVTLEFSWTANGEQAVLEGESVLKRLDFDVGGGEWADEEAVANEVQVRTRLLLHANTDSP